MDIFLLFGAPRIETRVLAKLNKFNTNSQISGIIHTHLRNKHVFNDAIQKLQTEDDLLAILSSNSTQPDTQPLPDTTQPLPEATQPLPETRLSCFW
jgi:hypothetical protein